MLEGSDVGVGLSDARVTGPYHDIILSNETSVEFYSCPSVVTSVSSGAVGQRAMTSV